MRIFVYFLQGAHIIIVGIGDSIDMLEVYGIASQPIEKTVFIAQSFVDLPSLVDLIPQAVCNGIVISVDEFTFALFS